MDDSDRHQTRNRLIQCRLAQLVSACRYYNLKVSGSKQEVVERMLDFILSASQEERFQLPTALTSDTKRSLGDCIDPTSIRVHRTVGVGNSDGASSTSYQDSLTVRPLEDKLRLMFAAIDPFYPPASIEEPFVYSTICRAGSVNCSLDLLQLKVYRRQGYSVWLRGISFSASKERQVWPKELRVFVNMTQVVKVEEPKRLKKRRDDPFDLTPFLQSGRNQVQFSVTDPNPSNFGLAVILCSQVSDRSLVATVVTQSRESSLTRLGEILNLKSEESEDLFEDNPLGSKRILDLRCPISLEKAAIPAHGTACGHIRCFDLESFISVNRRTPNMNLRWLCPICQQTIFPRDLIIDSYISEILAATDETEVLICTETGQWEPMPSTVKHKDEDSDEDKHNITEPATIDVLSIDSEGSNAPQSRAISEASFPKKAHTVNEQEVIDLDD